MPDEPWLRRPDESPIAYDRFRRFRELPPSGRSVAALAGPGRRHGQLERWSRRHEWVARAAAWDDAQHAAEDAARLESLRSMHRVHAAAGRALMRAALEALRELNIGAVSAAEIATLARLGAQLERDTLTTSVAELQGVVPEDDPFDVIARELTASS